MEATINQFAAENNMTVEKENNIFTIVADMPEKKNQNNWFLKIDCNTKDFVPGYQHNVPGAVSSRKLRKSIKKVW